MSKTKAETVQKWKESLAESARTAVEALSAITPIDQLAPSIDEASDILGHAMLQIRVLVRPEPKTLEFDEEAAWYRKEGEEKPAGECHTPQEALDFVLANPPMGNMPSGADGTEGTTASGEGRHMSYPEASTILMELARNRTMSVDQVNALEMGVRRLLVRHFQRQRNWAKRRAARSVCGDSVAAPHPAPLTPDEELADTIKRQNEEVRA